MAAGASILCNGFYRLLLFCVRFCIAPAEFVWSQIFVFFEQADKGVDVCNPNGLRHILYLLVRRQQHLRRLFDLVAVGQCAEPSEC